MYIYTFFVSPFWFSISNISYAKDIVKLLYIYIYIHIYKMANIEIVEICLNFKNAICKI